MENTVPIISIFIILGIPFLPTLGLSYRFVDHPLTRLLLIAFVIYAIRQGAMSGLLAFLAVFTLLIERNHEVLTTLPDQIPRAPTAPYGLPIQSPGLVPEGEMIVYEPSDEQGKDVVETHGETTTMKEYESADDIQDSNPRVPTVSDEQYVYERLPR